MTKNQIAYYDLVEKRRSNMAQESLSDRSIQETSRHNVATEAFNLSSLAEQTRHNKANEAYNLSSLAETTRHNLSSEAISRTGNQLRRDELSETTRHNLNSETISRTGNQLKRDELNFNKAKEDQRIQESLRDYNELVRYHNLNAINGRALQALLNSSGMQKVLSNAGIAIAGTTNRILYNIRDYAQRALLSASAVGNTIHDAVSSVANSDFATAFGNFVTKLPLLFEQQMDMVTPVNPDATYHPNNSNIH